MNGPDSYRESRNRRSMGVTDAGIIRQLIINNEELTITLSSRFHKKIFLGPNHLSSSWIREEIS